jgi:hypothetical protein
VTILGPTYGEYAPTWRSGDHGVTTVRELSGATNASIVVLANPNNPDGHRNPPEVLLALAEGLHGRGGWLIVDEAFAAAHEQTAAGMVGIQTITVAGVVDAGNAQAATKHITQTQIARQVAGQVWGQTVAPASERDAWFVAALCLAWPDGHTETFLGRVDGTAIWPPRGGKGFGYDPMFVPLGGTETFGEMDPGAKHAISHRARAFAQVLAACFG